MKSDSQLAWVLDSEARGCANVDVVADQRVRRTTISSQTARQLGFGGDRGAVVVRLRASGCGPVVVPVEVDDELTAASGIQMVLGQDFVRRAGATVTGHKAYCCRHPS